MARKTAPSYQTEQSVFASRLRSRMEEQRENQSSLAKKVGVQRQTISLYTNGQSKPDTDVLTKIAQELHISSDWLLGLSDYKSKDNECVSTAELGLTEESIKLIKKVINAGWNDGITGMNAFLSDLSFFGIAKNMVELQKLFSTLRENFSVPENTIDRTKFNEITFEEDGSCKLPPHETGKALLQILIADFSNIVEQYIDYHSFEEAYFTALNKKQG